jgi:hypothetical protein
MRKTVIAQIVAAPLAFAAVAGLAWWAAPAIATAWPKLPSPMATVTRLSTAAIDGYLNFGRAFKLNELARREAKAKAREAALDAREGLLNNQEGDLLDQFHTLEVRIGAVTERERALDQREAARKLPPVEWVIPVEAKAQEAQR